MNTCYFLFLLSFHPIIEPSFYVPFLQKILQCNDHFGFEQYFGLGHQVTSKSTSIGKQTALSQLVVGVPIMKGVKKEVM